MKPIGEIIRGLFPGGSVPDEISVEQAEELVSKAKAEEADAAADVARKNGLLEDVLSTAALVPNDTKQQAAAATAATAHHKAELRLKSAQALVRGAAAKLEAAQARERAEAEQVRAAEIRATAARLIEVAAQADLGLDLAWASVREFQALHLQLAQGNRDVRNVMIDARVLIEARLQSRFGGTTRLVGFAVMARDVAAAACADLPKISPAAGNDGAVEAPPAAPAPAPGGLAARAET
jgi:hypothetical protein